MRGQADYEEVLAEEHREQLRKGQLREGQKVYAEKLQEIKHPRNAATPLRTGKDVAPDAPPRAQPLPTTVSGPPDPSWSQAELFKYAQNLWALSEGQRQQLLALSKLLDEAAAGYQDLGGRLRETENAAADKAQSLREKSRRVAAGNSRTVSA
mmetsp:Transcript_66216/g.156391  ORF Transcript_66216/g.156391 Transcript_66216/m.156391 type:complete len:153 (+) Transcript_66216:924-1382(+)